MARKKPGILTTDSPPATDDFRLIKGIGPKNAKHLHDAGIRKFAQLAKKKPEDIAIFIPNRSARQIRNQGWIPQARKLASPKTESKSHKKTSATTSSIQHYENFTLEFLLNEKNSLRRLRIMHVQSGDVETWSNWKPEEIIYFLARHTRARLIQSTSSSKTLVPNLVLKHPAPQQEESPKSEKTVVSPIAATENTNRTLPQIPTRNLQPQPTVVAEVNQIRLLEWTNLLSNSNKQISSLSHDQNFNIRLLLDLTNISMPGNTRLDVTGMVFAKKIGQGARQLIAETKSTIPFAAAIDLNFVNASLTPGLYRLEAFIKINSINLSSNSIDASFQSELIQIY